MPDMKQIFLLFLAGLLLSGCSLGGTKSATPSSTSSIWKSVDSGTTFAPKGVIDGNTSISTADVLSFDFHPTNSDIIYIGTLADGIFRTTNQAEQWEQVYFPPEKVYGFAIDPSNGDRLYASGVYQDVSKIYLSENAGTDWREVYTEPGKSTVITALAIDPNKPSHIVAGTSTGVVIESLDSGNSWKNLEAFDGPVTQLYFIQKNSGTLLALVQNKDIVVSHDGGTTWNTKDKSTLPDLTFDATTDTETVTPTHQNALTVDQAMPGTLYTGTNTGIYKSADYGKTWSKLNILKSAEKFPIRAIDLNPKNSQEIAFVAGTAFYRSQDGGETWSTTELPVDRPVNILRYDPHNPEILYLSLRKQ